MNCILSHAHVLVHQMCHLLLFTSVWVTFAKHNHCFTELLDETQTILKIYVLCLMPWGAERPKQRWKVRKYWEMDKHIGLVVSVGLDDEQKTTESHWPYSSSKYNFQFQFRTTNIKIKTSLTWCLSVHKRHIRAALCWDKLSFFVLVCYSC